MRFRSTLPAVALTLAGLCAVAAPLARAADPAADAAASDAQSSVRMAREVSLYRQLDSLGLTDVHVKDIATRLDYLDKENSRVEKLEAAALAPVSDQLQRMQAALLSGRAPAPADLTAVDTAWNSLKDAHDKAAGIRRQMLTDIRNQLNRQQLDLVRSFVGMDPDPGDPPPGAPSGGFGGPGGPGGGFGGRGRAPGGGGFDPAQMVTRLLDGLRGAPPDRQTRGKDRLIQMMARMSGQDPNGPQFAQTKAALTALLDRAITLPDDQYQASKDQLAASLGAIMGPAMARGFSRGMVNTRGALDDEAVRRFFLQPEAARYLKIKSGSAAR